MAAKNAKLAKLTADTTDVSDVACKYAIDVLQGNEIKCCHPDCKVAKQSVSE